MCGTAQRGRLPPAFAPPDARAWSETLLSSKAPLGIAQRQEMLLGSLVLIALTVSKLLTVESHIPLAERSWLLVCSG